MRNELDDVDVGTLLPVVTPGPPSGLFVSCALPNVYYYTAVTDLDFVGWCSSCSKG